MLKLGSIYPLIIPGGTLDGWYVRFATPVPHLMWQPCIHESCFVGLHEQVEHHKK